MIQIGLCGWDSRSLYEPGIRPQDKLSIYSAIYSTVEVNSTFYNFPRPATIEKWHATVPEDFRFSIKLNRLFSHETQLELDPWTLDQLRQFLGSFSALGDKLSWFLLQLPPSLSMDESALDGFLFGMRRIMSQQRIKCGIAVEFRHPSWYAEVPHGILGLHDATQVISSSPGLWPCAWAVQTRANYVRLHGLNTMYHTPYRNVELDALKAWIDHSPAADSWIYFDNTATHGARTNSQYLMQRYGLAVPEQTRQLSMLDLVAEDEAALFIPPEE